jgi:hypothetical protein
MGRGGLIQFAREIGLRLVGSGPDAQGWWTCRAIDREDINPSASFHGETGHYVDHGPSGAKFSIFDLAMRLGGCEYHDLGTTIDKLGDRYIGERKGTKPIRAAAVTPSGAPIDGEPETGEVDATPIASPAVDVAALPHRVLDIVESKNLSLLYRDVDLLADLARVERADPAAFAGLKSDLSKQKGFRAKDFSAALAQHCPAGESPPEGKGKASDVGLLIELGGDCIELFHDPGGKPYALIRDGDRLETLPLRGPVYRQFLKGRFFATTGYTPGPETFRSALDVLELHAGEGPVHEVYLRTAEVIDPAEENNASLFLDLADKDRRAVRITKEGWAVVADPPVRFRRPQGMKPLPEPVRGGSLDELWQFVNVREAERPLVVGWETAAIRPNGPFAILILNGEQGSAKTSTSNSIRRLIDSHVTSLRGTPIDERDLMIAASNSCMLAFDNLSYLPDWLSDGLCRIATGSGFACRQLYTDEEEVFLSACRPIMFNGIEEISGRGDLLQRAILLDLPLIPDKDRRAERGFWRDFEEAHPRILGALLDLVVGALTVLPGIKLDRLPRMADFALWGEAVSRAMGRPEGEFLAAYSLNQEKAVEIALESSPVAMAVISLMGRRTVWTGTAQGLLAELEVLVQSSARRKNWPGTPRGLSGALRRAAPALRSLGIVVDFRLASDANKTRTITLRSADKTTGPEGS